MRRVEPNRRSRPDGLLAARAPRIQAAVEHCDRPPVENADGLSARARAAQVHSPRAAERSLPSDAGFQRRRRGAKSTRQIARIIGSVNRTGRLGEELSEHRHAASRDRLGTAKAALQSLDDRTSGQHRPAIRHRRRGQPRARVARAAQHPRQPTRQARATPPSRDPHSTERVRIRGPHADPGGKIAIEPRSLPAHNHPETYPAPPVPRRTNPHRPTGRITPERDGRWARGEASRTIRILGDRHLASNRGPGAVNDALRNHRRVYRNCEDPCPARPTRADARQRRAGKSGRHGDVRCGQATSPDHRPARDGKATPLPVGGIRLCHPEKTRINRPAPSSGPLTRYRERPTQSRRPPVSG